jgi:hypothetical protein
MNNIRIGYITTEIFISDKPILYYSNKSLLKDFARFSLK